MEKTWTHRSKTNEELSVRLGAGIKTGEKPEYVLPAERRLSGALYSCLQLPAGRVLRRQSHSFLRGEQLCNQRQETQAESCKTSIKD